MSPVMLRKGKYMVVIYVKDHPPAHAHVKSAGKEAKIRLDPVEVLENWGFKPQEIRAILAIIQDHQRQLLEKWDEFYSSRE